MEIQKWELEQYLRDLPTPLPDAGYIQVISAFETGALRRANSGPSPSVQYASELMGHTVELESHGVEYYAARQYELLEKDVFAYFPQAIRLTIEYESKDKKGKQRRVVTATVVDFLVLRRDGIFLEEWKTISDLQQLVIDRPGRFKCKDDGTFYSPPCETSAARLGYFYRIRTSNEGLFKIVCKWLGSQSIGSRPSKRIASWFRTEGQLKTGRLQVR